MSARWSDSRVLTRAVAAADHVPARARGVEHHAAGKDPLASPVRLLGRPEWRCSPPHPARPFSYLSPSADACATSTRPRRIPLTRPRSSSAPPRHARSPLYPDMLAHSTTTRARSARRRFAPGGSAVDGNRISQSHLQRSFSSAGSTRTRTTASCCTRTCSARPRTRQPHRAGTRGR